MRFAAGFSFLIFCACRGGAPEPLPESNKIPHADSRPQDAGKLPRQSDRGAGPGNPKAAFARIERLNPTFSLEESIDALTSFIRLMEAQGNLRPDADYDVELPPILDFIDKYPRTAVATTAVLYLATLVMLPRYEFAQSMLSRISQLENTGWRASLAKWQLADLERHKYEWDRGHRLGSDFERYWEDKRAWYEKNLSLAKELDQASATDIELQALLRVRWPSIRAFEIHNYVTRANTYYQRKQFHGTKVILGEVEKRFKAHPEYAYYESFIRQWFSELR